MRSFTVFGTAQPAGSKRRGRFGGVFEDNPKADGWKKHVAAVAGADYGHLPLLEGPLGLRITVYRVRPKGHFGTGRNAGQLKPSAPTHPTTKPDTTKLVRGIEDALTGVLWRDDAQVVEQHATKAYGEPARVQVQVWPLGE
jgi:Holliday junction resolvase RusA-like endonuclease